MLLHAGIAGAIDDAGDIVGLDGFAVGVTLTPTPMEECCSFSNMLCSSMYILSVSRLFSEMFIEFTCLLYELM